MAPYSTKLVILPPYSNLNILVYWSNFFLEGSIIPHVNKSILELKVILSPYHASTSNIFWLLDEMVGVHYFYLFYININDKYDLTAFTGLTMEYSNSVLHSEKSLLLQTQSWCQGRLHRLVQLACLPAQNCHLTEVLVLQHKKVLFLTY